MLGLGESQTEVLDVLADLLDAGCDYLTLGQYLMPSANGADHYLPVVRYIPPEEFAQLGKFAKAMGFAQVASGPFVRSSYHAREMAEVF
jgi:lipoic acid synthetase